MAFTAISINACKYLIVFNYNTLYENSVKPGDNSVIILNVLSSGFMFPPVETNFT